METWLLYAILASLFAGVNAVLAKVGISGVKSHLATAVRTVVVVLFSWLLVFWLGSHQQIAYVSGRSWLFLIASGLATGGSWLCFFYALKFGTVSNVTPLKKGSTVLTIALSFIILGEVVGIPHLVGVAFIIAGTVIMLKKKDGSKGKAEGGGNWILFGILAAVFASLSTIFGAIGIQYVDANLGNAIRVVVVLLASLVMVLFTRQHRGIPTISKKSLLFLTLSGLATGGSWLFFFHALQTGPVSAVVPIDKLSIIFNIVFASIFLKERQSIRRIIGLVCLVAGTLLLVIWAA